jgi:hypothetical protein
LDGGLAGGAVTNSLLIVFSLLFVFAAAAVGGFGGLF